MRHYQLETDHLIPSDPKELRLFEGPLTFSIAAPHELRKIKDISLVNEYTILECLDVSKHVRMDCHPTYSYGLLSAIEVDGDKATVAEFRFYLTASSLLLVYRDENKLVNRFVEDLSHEVFLQKYEAFSPQVLILALIESIIESNEEYLEAVEDSIEALEEKVLADARREYSKEIVAKRRQIMHIKHYIEPMLYVIQAFTDNENTLFSPTQVKAMKILASKASGMVSNVLMLRDYATQVREAFQAEHDIKSNDIMKVFTVVTSIFLPLSLIVGWYGMNFSTMPELDWRYGYVYVIALNLLVVAGCLYLFRRKKWM